MLEAFGDGLQLGVGGLERSARRQPRDGAREMSTAEEDLAAEFRLPGHRLPDVDSLEGKGETSRRHSDDLCLLAIDPNATSNDMSIAAKPLAP